MCTVLTRRFPALEIRLFPVQVQGEEAAAGIVKAIEYFNDEFGRLNADAWRADLLIVARGGGSFEDLFCFNDENLVRAVAASKIPTISAVGHETDFTLCDFAADARAGTPSIAAERAVPVLEDLKAGLLSLDGRLIASLRAKGEWFAQRVDHLGDSLYAALRICFERLENRFGRAETKLALLSPYSVLERGYSLTVNEQGDVVKDAADLAAGSRITTRFSKGEVVSEVV
jgi:exodeoxyribonuclease VII large subunit